MCHAIERARERKRGGLDLTYFDLKMIEIMIGLDLAKDVTKQYNILMNYNNKQRIYQLRYGGKLLKPVVDTSKDNFIITFLPSGKNQSYEKYIKRKKRNVKYY